MNQLLEKTTVETQELQESEEDLILLCNQHTKIQIKGIQTGKTSSKRRSYCDECQMILQSPLEMKQVTQLYQQLFNEDNQAFNDIFQPTNELMKDLSRIVNLFEKMFLKIQEIYQNIDLKRKEFEKEKKMKPIKHFTLSDLETFAHYLSHTENEKNTIRDERIFCYQKYQKEFHESNTKKFLIVKQEIEKEIGEQFHLKACSTKKKSNVKSQEHEEDLKFEKCSTHQDEKIKWLNFRNSPKLGLFCYKCLPQCQNDLIDLQQKFEEYKKDLKKISNKLQFEAQQFFLMKQQQIEIYFKEEQTQIEETRQLISQTFNYAKQKVNHFLSPKLFAEIYFELNQLSGEKMNQSQDKRGLLLSRMHNYISLYLNEINRLLKGLFDSSEKRNLLVGKEQLQKIYESVVNRCNIFQRDLDGKSGLELQKFIQFIYFNENTQNLYLIYYSQIEIWDLTSQIPQEINKVIESLEKKIDDFQIHSKEYYFILLLEDQVKVYQYDKDQFLCNENGTITMKGVKKCQIDQTTQFPRFYLLNTDLSLIIFEKQKEQFLQSKLLQLNQPYTLFCVNSQNWLAAAFQEKISIWKVNGKEIDLSLSIEVQEFILSIKSFVPGKERMNSVWMILTSKSVRIYEKIWDQTKINLIEKVQLNIAPILISMNSNKIIFKTLLHLHLFEYDESKRKISPKIQNNSNTVSQICLGEPESTVFIQVLNDGEIKKENLSSYFTNEKLVKNDGRR